MIVTHDIFTLTVLLIVLAIVVCKGNRKKNDLPANKMSDGRDFAEWYRELCEKNRKSNEDRLEKIRYEKWLVEHQ